MNIIRLALLIGVGLFASLNLHAQTAMVGSFNRIGTPIQTAPPDSIVQVTAEAQGLSLVAPEDLPFGGTFWEVMPSGIMAPLPCPPIDQTLPIYAITDTAFLVDATGGQVTVNTRQLKTMSLTQAATSDVVASALDTQATAIVDLINQVQTASANQQVRTMAMAMGVPSLGGDTGSSTNSNSPNGMQMSPPDYGTNFWIAQWKLTNHAVTGFVSNTISDIPYEIQANTDLATTNWGSTGLFIYGSETTNWTALSFMSASLTNNCFFRLRSWASSDGSGLPDWWQEQYFGVSSGVDPYGNPAGDGYSNLQKFQAGMNPNQFYTPAAPQGVKVNYTSANGVANVNWLSSAGSVTGYTIKDSDGNTFNVSTTGFTQSVPYAPDFNYGASGNPTMFKSYQVQAHYAGGNSAWNSPMPLQPATVLGTMIPAPGGGSQLEVVGIPANAVKVRLLMFYQGETYGNGNLYPFTVVTNLDIPVENFTNGVCPAASSWLNLAALPSPLAWSSHNFYLQAVDANGNASGGSYLSENWVPVFYDGRVQLKQNLIFQLRAASVDAPFHFFIPATNVYDNGDFGEYVGYYTYATNYAYASLYPYSNPSQNSYFGNTGTFDALWPFEENCLFRNFVFTPADVDGSGTLTNGMTTFYYNGYPILYRPLAYHCQTNWTSFPALLATNSTRWLYYNQSDEYDDAYGVGLLNIQYNDNDATLSMSSGYRNWFGLSYTSVNVAYHGYDDNYNDIGLTTNVVSAGDSFTSWVFYYAQPNTYLESAQPQFQTMEYDFFNPKWTWNEALQTGIPPGVPGDPSFAPTNTSPQWFAAVGSQIQIAAYAKLALQNGYSGVFGFLGQYFDKAYKMTNGVATTNTTGVLSPYGSFFATEPGPTALVTMPDLDTGARGTCIVHAVSLQLDKNHDGTMDSAWNGPDATSQASPMVAWVNNGHCEAGINGGLDIDKAVPPATTNYLAQQITCQRDLENFFRLWICGVPALAFSNGYSATITCTAITGTPAINIYAAETNGGTLYLTDTNTAQSLVNEYAMGTAGTGSGQTCILPNDFFDGKKKYLLFEGAGIGEGQFTLTIYQGTTAIAQTSTYIDLHDIKGLYEQAHTENIDTAPPSTKIATLVKDKELPTNPAEDQQVIVFVHGINNSEFDYYDSSETMFKRLYWQGYQGRFAAFRWPSPLFKAIPTSSDEISYLGFNTGEYISWHSGAALKAYIDDLHSRLTNYTVNLAAHSLGNVAANEAIREGAQVDNYALMQAAISAEAFDGNNAALNYSYLTASGLPSSPDANALGGYNNCATNATRRVNFYNDDDWALFRGAVGFGATLYMWEGNQHDYKPDRFTYPGPISVTYSFDGTNCYFNEAGIFSTITNRLITEDFEKKAFVARSRTKAVGAAGLKYAPFALTGGLVSTNISLQDANLGFVGGAQFGNSRPEHSGEFTKPIQNTTPFYFQLLKTGFQMQPQITP